jgi:hypothetical protein
MRGLLFYLEEWHARLAPVAVPAASFLDIEHALACGPGTYNVLHINLPLSGSLLLIWQVWHKGISFILGLYRSSILTKFI